MNTRTLLVALLLPIAVHAQPVKPPPAAVPTPTPPSDSAELVALDQFLNLSDAELAQMAAAIARVRAMSPAQREQLRQEIAAFRDLPEPQRERLRQGWAAVPPEIQAGWREMMQHITPQQHAAIQACLQSLSPAERVAYRQRLVEEYLKNHPAK